VACDRKSSGRYQKLIHIFWLRRGATAICDCIYSSFDATDFLVRDDSLRSNSTAIQSFHCSIDNPADLLGH